MNKDCFDRYTKSVHGRMANNTLEILTEVQDEVLCFVVQVVKRMLIVNSTLTTEDQILTFPTFASFKIEDRNRS